MLYGSRARIALGATAAALVLGVFGASPVAADGEATFSALHDTVVAKDGLITLRFTYNCVQYDAPHNDTDILSAGIFTPSTGNFYHSEEAVICDGTDRRLKMMLNGGPGSGDAALVFVHLGNSTTSTTGEYVVHIPTLRVVVPGPK